MNDSAKNEDLNEFLFRANLLRRGQKAVWTPLAGGVSSDIWRVDLPDKILCVKRALANLRVEAEWRAPIERNEYEWEWFKFVDRNFPGIVPRPVAHNSEMQMLAMEFLAPENYQVWKTELLKGNIDAEFAGRVGSFLGKIHAKSALNKEIAETFATDKLFYALRIEPYLLATAEKHNDIAPKIKKIAQRILTTKLALVHGDVSPKNILVGKNDPVFLDAETAWFGDPAFDAAFCLNHLLLKAYFHPALKKEYLKCFQNFIENYLSQVNWEESRQTEARIMEILPVLNLARIDGKSPAEYIVNEKLKSAIRLNARQFIIDPASRNQTFYESVLL